MKKTRIRFSPPSKEAIEDIWQRRGTAAAIKAVRGVVQPGGAILPGAPIGRLSDIEAGWIVTAALFGWISVRAEQATGEGLDAETTIRDVPCEPSPWDAGAVAAILRELSEVPGFDWSKSLVDWSQEEMIDFLLTALGLIRKAMAARDSSGRGITRQPACYRALNDGRLL